MSKEMRNTINKFKNLLKEETSTNTLYDDVINLLDSKYQGMDQKEVNNTLQKVMKDYRAPIKADDVVKNFNKKVVKIWPYQK
jgi:hypothetical protein